MLREIVLNLQKLCVCHGNSCKSIVTEVLPGPVMYIKDIQ